VLGRGPELAAQAVELLVQREVGLVEGPDLGLGHVGPAALDLLPDLTLWRRRIDGMAAAPLPEHHEEDDEEDDDIGAFAAFMRSTKAPPIDPIAMIELSRP